MQFTNSNLVALHDFQNAAKGGLLCHALSLEPPNRILQRYIKKNNRGI